jgi:ribosomal protein S18 acetylase RimI-like enzyme
MERLTLDDEDPSGARGFLVWRAGSGRTVEIFDIAVPNEYRRQGHGRTMVNKLVDRLMPTNVVLLWAITRSDNVIAKQFYEELGFRIVANLWNFYQDTEQRNTVDAVMYGRDLSEKVRRAWAEKHQGGQS